MNTYRKLPVEIQACQFTGSNADEICQWVGAAGVIGSDGLYISTLEGTMHVSEGDWVLRGVQGEFYPCKPDIFTSTYEPVNNG